MLRESLLALIDRCPLSDRELSLRATGSTDTVRNIRRGGCPRLDTVEALCELLGLDLHPVRVCDPSPVRVPLPPGPSAFDPAVPLPVRLCAHAERAGVLEPGRVDGSAPAPCSWADTHAFYLLVDAPGVAPAGIAPGDACLVSPAAALEPGQIVWFRFSAGTEAVVWFLGFTSEGFDVAGWSGTSTPVRTLLRRDALCDRGRVAVVYPHRPAPGAVLRPRPAWTPEPVDLLWRRAVVDGDAAARELRDLVAPVADRVGDVAAFIGRARRSDRFTQGDLDLVHRVVAGLLRRSLLSLDSLVETAPAGAGSEPPGATGG